MKKKKLFSVHTHTFYLFLGLSEVQTYISQDLLRMLHLQHLYGLMWHPSTSTYPLHISFVNSLRKENRQIIYATVYTIGQKLKHCNWMNWTKE